MPLTFRPYLLKARYLIKPRVVRDVNVRCSARCPFTLRNCIRRNQLCGKMHSTLEHLGELPAIYFRPFPAENVFFSKNTRCLDGRFSGMVPRLLRKRQMHPTSASSTYLNFKTLPMVKKSEERHGHFSRNIFCQSVFQGLQ